MPKREELLRFNWENDVDFYKKTKEPDIWKLTKEKRKENGWGIKKFDESILNT